jgi:Superinfection immunity protein
VVIPAIIVAVRSVSDSIAVAEVERTYARDYGYGLLAFGVIAYLMPTVVALLRHHHNKTAITLLNILLGWTVIGWIVALVWSATAVRRELQTSSRGRALRCGRCGVAGNAGEFCTACGNLLTVAAS